MLLATFMLFPLQSNIIALFSAKLPYCADSVAFSAYVGAVLLSGLPIIVPFVHTHTQNADTQFVLWTTRSVTRINPTKHFHLNNLKQLCEVEGRCQLFSLMLQVSFKVVPWVSCWVVKSVGYEVPNLNPVLEEIYGWARYGLMIIKNNSETTWHVFTHYHS